MSPERSSRDARGKKPPRSPKGARDRARSESRSEGRSASRGAPRGGAGAGRGAREGAGEESRSAHLSKAVIGELMATARPGKGEILVKVFGEAAQAFLEDDLREAIRLGEQSKHMALRSAAVRELLGIAYYRAGKWSEATRELSTFRRISGSTEQNPVLADAYRAMKKPDKAVALCDEVTKGTVDMPVYYEAQIVGAGAMADMGLLDEAISRLETLDLKPAVADDHHLRAWYALADLLEKRGRYTQAEELFEAVASADADATDAPSRAARLRAQSR